MLPMVRRRIGRTLTFFCCLLLWGATTAVQAQTPSSGITIPASGETVSGLVTVRGTAVHPDYLRYELAFFQEANPAAGWIVFAEGSEPVIDGTLALWDTTVGRNVGAPIFPDGLYRLRLRVVKRDYNYDEYFVLNLLVSNDAPTPTPTIDVTATAVTGGQLPAAVTAVFSQPTPLPSLTPFPTPTPAATLENPNSGAAVGAATPSGGALGQIRQVDGRRLTAAFWLGVWAVILVFTLLLLYLLLRAVVRRLWQQWWSGRSFPRR